MYIRLEVIILELRFYIIKCIRWNNTRIFSSTLTLTLVLDSHFAPRKETWYPLYRRLDVSQGCSGWVQKILPILGFDHQNIQRVASWHTNCAIPARTTHEYYFYYLSPVISLGLQGSINESGLGLLSWWASS
jgi:hypothetical protein